MSAGQLNLAATAPPPGPGLPVPAVSVAFQVVADQLSLVAVEPQMYIAEQTPVTVELDAVASENGSPAAGVGLVWSASAGTVSFSKTQTVTAADGSTATLAALPGLAAAAQAGVQACAQFGGLGSACAGFTATGVSGAAMQVAIVQGGMQTISAAASPAGYAPVIAQVTDASGDPVMAASVTVYQTVTARASACPALGRCPAAPVVASLVTAAQTDARGQIRFPPLTVAAPQSGVVQTQIAVSAGTQGFTATVLTTTP